MQKPLKELEIGTIYLIHNKDSGCHKIGITMNWSRRKRELEVGTKNIEIKTATVINPMQIEQGLFRKYKVERLPQTEYLKLSPIQVLEVIKLFDIEASKLQGDDADLHLKYAALEYEIKKAGARVPVEKLIELEKIKRQLYPEYNARVIAREAQKQAQVIAREAQKKAQKRMEVERWNSYGRWEEAAIIWFLTSIFLTLPHYFLLLLIGRVLQVPICGSSNQGYCLNFASNFSSDLFIVWMLGGLAFYAYLWITRASKKKRRIDE